MKASALRTHRPTPERLELAFPCRRDSCEGVRLAVDAFLAPWKPDAEALFAVELVLEEILVNIVWHGQAQAMQAPVRLAVDVRPDAFVLRFEDEGIAFDPTQAPPPEVPDTVAQARPGGLGIELVRKFAREMAYERSGGCNRLAVTIARA